MTTKVIKDEIVDVPDHEGKRYTRTYEITISAFVPNRIANIAETNQHELNWYMSRHLLGYMENSEPDDNGNPS